MVNFMTWQKRLKQLGLPALLLAASPAIAMPSFENGSFSGFYIDPFDLVIDIGVNLTPDDWTASEGTPDSQKLGGFAGFGYNGGILDLFNPWGLGPDANGENEQDFVGLYSSSGVSSESIGQEVGGFTIGNAYAISWEQGNFGNPDRNAADDAWVGVSVDSVVIGTGAVGTLSSSWFQESLLFVATATSHFIEFTALTEMGNSAYLSLDNVSISCGPGGDCEPISLPSTLLLSLLALFGLGLGRRKTI